MSEISPPPSGIKRFFGKITSAVKGKENVAAGLPQILGNSDKSEEIPVASPLTVSDHETSEIPRMVQTSPIPLKEWGVRQPIVNSTLPLEGTDLDLFLQPLDPANPSSEWERVLRFNFMIEEPDALKRVTQEQPRSYGRATKSPIKPLVVNGIPFKQLSEKGNGVGIHGMQNRFPDMTEEEIIFNMILKATNYEPTGVTGIKSNLIDMVITNEIQAAGARVAPSLAVVPFDKYDVINWFNDHPEIVYPGEQILEYVTDPYISVYFRPEPNTARSADLWNPSPDRNSIDFNPDTLGRYSQRAILLRTFQFYKENIDNLGIENFAYFYSLKIEQVRDVYESFQQVLADPSYELDLKGKNDIGQDVESKLPINEVTQKAVKGFLFLDSYFSGWNIGVVSSTSIHRFNKYLMAQAGYALDHFTGGIDTDWENNFNGPNLFPQQTTMALEFYADHTAFRLFNTLSRYTRSDNILATMLKALKSGAEEGQKHADTYFTSLGNSIAENSPLQKISEIEDIQILPKRGEIVQLNEEYQKAYDLLSFFLRPPIMDKNMSEEYLQRISILFSQRQQEHKALHAASFYSLIRDTWSDFKNDLEKSEKKTINPIPLIFSEYNGRYIFSQVSLKRNFAYICVLEPDPETGKYVFSGSMKVFIHNPTSPEFNRNDFELTDSSETIGLVQQIDMIKNYIGFEGTWGELQKRGKDIFLRPEETDFWERRQSSSGYTTEELL